MFDELDGLAPDGPDVRFRGAPVVRNSPSTGKFTSQGVGGPIWTKRELGRLLAVREVAEALNVSRAKVYRLVDRGLLEHVWIDASIRILESSLERLPSKRRDR